MTTISTKIPDTLFRQAKSIAESEEITFDEVFTKRTRSFSLNFASLVAFGSSNSNIS